MAGDASAVVHVGPSEATSYLGVIDEQLVNLLDPETPPPAIAQLVHDSFRGMVESPAWSCVGGKAAVHQGFYRICVLGPMGSAAATRNLADALERFVAERGEWNAEFTTLLASFTDPVGRDELEFEQDLWRQLSELHRLDRKPWDQAVSSDPGDPHFSFSFAGEAFFVVGLHGGASRWARRFAWPTLAFNPHDQFERLRREDAMTRMQEAVRERDTALQGDINPNLADFGDLPDARQYSGRRVEADWGCPFEP